ncbi:MAG TPA: methyltransferase domain-containing protein [Polyangiaceae bacterium]
MADSTPNEVSQLERIEQYFGASALEWRDLYANPQRVNDLVLANRRRLAVEKLSTHAAPGTRVLDAGCGAGVVGLDLVQRGFFVQGVDIAENMLELARMRFQQAGVSADRYSFFRADVTHSDLVPESFGAIVALGFLEYQADELAALRRLWELLEPGGVLVVSGPSAVRLANYLGLAPVVRERLSRRGWLPVATGPVRIGLHRYSPERFRSLLSAAGFELVEHQGHGFVEFDGVSERLSYRSEVALHHGLSWLSKFLPIARFGNDLIAVGRRLKSSSSS